MDAGVLLRGQLVLLDDLGCDGEIAGEFAVSAASAFVALIVAR